MSIKEVPRLRARYSTLPLVTSTQDEEKQGERVCSSPNISVSFLKPHIERTNIRGVVAHVFNPSSLEAEEGRSL